MSTKDIRIKIINGEIDPNNKELFFGETIKAAILFLNNNIKLRDKRIPHFMINTGDEIMYRELMGYEYNKIEVTDENFIYNEIPRCIVDVSEIQTIPDQLTQPYVRGVFDLEYEDNVYEFTAEIKRVPVQMTLSLKYYIDSFTDCLSLSQYIISNLCYIRNFRFVYMGNEVKASLTIPESQSVEKQSSLQFDSENRYKTMELSLTLETNLPVFDIRTCIESDAVISKVDNNIGRKGMGMKDEFYKKRKYKNNGEEITEEQVSPPSLGKRRLN